MELFVGDGLESKKIAARIDPLMHISRDRPVTMAANGFRGILTGVTSLKRRKWNRYERDDLR